MLLKELLQEASSPGRAWNNKLKRVDALLAWMYDKGILTKGEKAKKDSVFHQYYRYYNDGDIPKALRLKGFSKWSDKKELETALEEYLETFIKEMLAKYLPKVDRAEFRLDKIMSDLATVIDVAERHDAHSLLTYWLKKVKIDDPEMKLKVLIDRLQEQYDTLTDAVNAVSPSTSNTVMSYRREKLKNSKEWTADFENKYKAMVSTIDDITEFLQHLMISLKRIKKEHLAGKSE